MTVTVTHSTAADGTFSAEGALAWDANHTLTGLGTMAEQNANNVAITGGSITGVTGLGDVVGPASSTDNAVARYDTTTGKLLQNSLVLIGDTGSVTGVDALTCQSLTVNNNATLGSSNTDTLDVRSRISSDLDPETNNAKDIGSNGRNWRDGFFGRTVHAASYVGVGGGNF